jgi:hypothetical protein
VEQIARLVFVDLHGRKGRKSITAENAENAETDSGAREVEWSGFERAARETGTIMGRRMFLMVAAEVVV